jgi:predicted nuclease with TOPRIM domain
MNELGATLSNSSIAQTATYVVFALVGIVFGIQKLLKNWKETSTETNIIGLMHEELTRLSKHNQTLAEELNKFQLEVLKLNRQLDELTRENGRSVSYTHLRAHETG